MASTAETPSPAENTKTPESKDSIITEAKKKMQSLLAEMGFKKWEKPGIPNTPTPEGTRMPDLKPEAPGMPNIPNTPNAPTPEGPGKPDLKPEEPGRPDISQISSTPGGTIGIGNLEGGVVSGPTSWITGPEGFNWLVPEKPITLPEAPGKPIDTPISIPGGTNWTGNLDGWTSSGTATWPTAPTNFVWIVNPTNPFWR